MTRILGCLAAASVAWFIAKALNVPVWQNWISGE